jgi:hypothetical protein
MTNGRREDALMNFKHDYQAGKFVREHYLLKLYRMIVSYSLLEASRNPRTKGSCYRSFLPIAGGFGSFGQRPQKAGSHSGWQFRRHLCRS